MKRRLHITFSFLLYILCFQLHAQIYFENQAATVGVDDYSGTIFLGGGISFCDYNCDGWDDITIGTQSGDPLKIYKNNGDGTYSPETTLFPKNNAQQRQVIWVDFDNDGDKDLFVSCDVDGSRLYRNDGTELVDITIDAGFPTAAQDNFGSSWGDYNNDGNLDVFLCNRGSSTPQPNYLYENNGNGTFTNVSASAGIDTGSHLSFCSAFFDFNNDGWQDIYMVNDKVNTTNILYKNNGDGTFTDLSKESGTDMAIDAMSVTIADFDRDGWFDIYVTNGIPGNYLLRNNGDETFTNMAFETGTMFESVAWGSVFLDAENDGDLDLYVSGSLDGSVPSLLSAAFYSNNGNGTFRIQPSTGFDNDTSESYSNAIGDTDNDGFPEIIVSNSGGDDIFLWKNIKTSSNNWLKVNLEGVKSNKQGVGATIELNSQGVSQYRYTVCGEGYISQNSETEFFGIGTNTIIDYVKVTWLGGAEDILYDVTPNQTLNIVEGSNDNCFDYLIEDLNCQQTTHNSITISWTLDSSVVMYNIYLDGVFYGETLAANLRIDGLPSITIFTIEVTAVFTLDCESAPTTITCETVSENDADGDGVPEGEDCDDNDPNNFPGNSESCDGQDNNCNNQVDEGLAFQDYFLDSDGDNYGDINMAINSCVQETGYVSNSEDCDDNNPNINPAAIEIPNNAIDEDCDGIFEIIDIDNDGYNSDDDCDDNNPNVFPGNTETCDGIDNNCNQEIDEGLTFNDYFLDQDNDGFGDETNMINDCTQPAGYVSDASDCDDSNPNIFPGNTETCDGIDNNCNQEIDEGLTFNDYFLDQDNDGFGDLTNVINDCIEPMGYVIDSTDCNDMNPSIFPGALEILSNDIDEDCDGMDQITAVHFVDGHEINIFPNPVVHFLNIETTYTGYNYSLFSMDKKIVMKGSILEKKIDLTQLNSGVYILLISSNSSVEFLINRILKI